MSLLKSRGLRLYGVTWLEESGKPLSNIIDSKERYNFCPYAYTPRGVVANLFYAQSSGVISLEPQSSAPIGAHFLLGVIMVIYSLDSAALEVREWGDHGDLQPPAHYEIVWL